MYLGVDLGTSSIKIILATQEGKIIDIVSIKYPISYPKKNYAEQEPTDWWRGFLVAMEELSQRNDLSKLEAVSFSGQMHGLVLLDRYDEVLRPAILWNDNRTIEECEYLNNEIGRDKLIEYTGNIALTGFTAPKILWVKKNEPEIFSKISRIMLPKDYLQYKITGIFASDVSDNSGSLYFDVRSKKWSKEMLDILGISESLLPQIYESADIVGEIKPELANKLGIPTSVVTVMGGGDQAMGAIGTGTIVEGELSISLGTSGVIFISTDDYIEETKGRLHSFCAANGSYHLMGVTNSCAATTKWWVEDILKVDDYAKVFAGIDKLPIDDLIFLPYMLGERSPINDPRAKGVFYGLNLMADRSTVSKAIVEGICFSLKHCIEVAMKNGVTPRSARVIGGGSKSKEWLQILADVLNIKVKSINTSEGGGLGAIILCMVATGKAASIKEACDKVIFDREEYRPDAMRTEIYKNKFIEYKKLYHKTRKID